MTHSYLDRGLFRRHIFHVTAAAELIRQKRANLQNFGLCVQIGPHLLHPLSAKDQDQ